MDTIMTSNVSSMHNRPVYRSKFDQFSSLLPPPLTRHQQNGKKINPYDIIFVKSVRVSQKSKDSYPWSTYINLEGSKNVI